MSDSITYYSNKYGFNFNSTTFEYLPDNSKYLTYILVELKKEQAEFMRTFMRNKEYYIRGLMR